MARIQSVGAERDFSKSGDGVLIYPGHHDGTDAAQGYGSPASITLDGPVPSYRLKVIRAGLQDWALFKLAKQRGFGALHAIKLREPTAN